MPRFATKTLSWKLIASTSICCLVLCSLTIFLAAHYFDICVVESDSMRPALRPGQRLLVTRYRRNLATYHRGDIIVVYAPTLHGLAVKRLVGLPGDRVSVRGGLLFLDGKRATEPYIVTHMKHGVSAREWPVVATGIPTHDRYIEIAESNIFVLGDNRDDSADSRIWGPLSDESIYGKVCAASSH